MTQEGNPSSASSSDTSLAGCFFTVFRNLVGPGLILVTGASLVMDKAKLGSVWDFIFAGAVLAAIGATLLSPQKPVSAAPTPGEIQPMSRSKFISIVISVAVAIFCFAHFVAPRLF